MSETLAWNLTECISHPSQQVLEYIDAVDAGVFA